MPSTATAGLLSIGDLLRMYAMSSAMVGLLLTNNSTTYPSPSALKPSADDTSLASTEALRVLSVEGNIVSTVPRLNPSTATRAM